MRIEMVKKENNKTEVLAPAGTYLSMKAAINAGADAVYLSGKRFGARAFAGNFSDEELLDALDYVHLHNKKLYLTVNTLLYDEELNELESYISKLYDNGLDAVIVQDMGVLSKLHKLFPELSLHASTQMCITHADSGDILKKYGVTRIVPARELSLADLKDMRERTDLEMEVFVHGALCYGYSGQCLFSYLMGNRSGNRGSCAGSCRMDYKCDLNNLKGAFSGDNKGIGEGHIFSMRENCALPVLDRMLEIGIDSLKIEGRMKKPEYVAMVTELYRKYTDLFESLGKEGYRRYIEDNRKEYERDLLYAADMYNREGFIHNYLLGNNKNIISYKRPNHGGVQVGRVIQVDNKKNVATYRAEKNIGSHDVVEFSGEDRKPKYEYTLKEGVSTGDKVSARFLKGSNIKVGDLVYRTRNEELIERIRKSYIEQDKKVSLSLFFTAKAEEKMELKISKNGLIKTYTSDFIPQRAENKPVEKERIEKLLSEMGDTSFLADNIEVDITNDLFIPVSAVKKLRRAALSDFFKELIKANVSRFKEEEDEIKRQKEIHPFKGKENTGENASENNDSSLNYNSLSEGIYVKLQTKEQCMVAVNNKKIKGIYLCLESFSPNEIKELTGLIRNAKKEVYISLPGVIDRTVENHLKGYWDILKDDEKLISGYLVATLDIAAFLINNFGISPGKIIGDTSMYIVNSEALKAYSNMGFLGLTLPFEYEEDNDNYKYATKVIYGKICAMISKGCVNSYFTGCEKEKGLDDIEKAPVKRINLTAKAPKKTPLKRDEFTALNYCKFCYNRVITRDAFDEINRLGQYKNKGINIFRIDFYDENKEEVERVLGRI